MSTADGQLPRTEAEIIAAGWAAGAPDTATPAIYQRWIAGGLGLHLAGLTQPQDGPKTAAEWMAWAKRQDEPKDAA